MEVMSSEWSKVKAWLARLQCAWLRERVACARLKSMGETRSERMRARAGTETACKNLILWVHKWQGIGHL